MAIDRLEGLVITKAERRQAKLRMFLSGRSGAGKSTTGALVAARIAQLEDVPFCYIDSEEGSADKLADLMPGFSFEKIELQGWKNGYSPQRYMMAIRMALEGGYGVIMIDSISQSWSGKDGVLEQVDEEKRTSRNPDKQAAWSVGTKLWNELVALIVGAPAHVVVCARSKTVYADVPDDKGKLKRQAVGTEYVARDGFEYEFDFFGDIEREGHVLTFDKNRSSGVVKDVWQEPGLDLANSIHTWLKAGGADVTMRTRELKQLQKPGVTGEMVADALRAAGLKGKDDFLDDEKFRAARAAVMALEPPAAEPEPQPRVGEAEPPVEIRSAAEHPAGPGYTDDPSAGEDFAEAPQAPPEALTRADLMAMTAVQLKRLADDRGLVQPGQRLKKGEVVDLILGRLASEHA